MIKSLRRKFIAIAMSAVVLVLVCIMTAINVANYMNVVSDADDLLSIIAENDGSIPQSGGIFDRGNISAETPYNTRYFTVIINDGTVIAADTTNIAAVRADTAAAYALNLYSEGKTSGFYGNYRYCVTQARIGEMYIFLDCESDLSSFRYFLLASVLISLVGVLVVFVLVLIFSKLVIKPIAQSYEKQKQFVTDAGHEIKTPLTIIDANTEVIEMTEGENEWTHSIRNQVKRLTAMTEKLVALSRMEEDTTKLNFVDFSLSDAVMETAEQFITAAEAKGKTLDINVEPNITCRGDEKSIRQLVSIFLDNALKYSEGDGVINLDLRNTGKNACLTVKNAAYGLKQGKHDELFERFYRADSSRNSETGGNGIGLSIAKAIVTAHGGKISAVSEDGKSLTFTVTL